LFKRRVNDFLRGIRREKKVLEKNKKREKIVY